MMELPKKLREEDQQVVENRIVKPPMMNQYGLPFDIYRYSNHKPMTKAEHLKNDQIIEKNIAVCLANIKKDSLVNMAYA